MEPPVGGKGEIEPRAAIEQHVPEAIEAIVNVMRGGGRNAGAKLSAAKAILDRAGFGPQQDVQINAVVTTIAEKIRANQKRIPPARQLDKPK